MSAIADALGIKIDFFSAAVCWALIFTRLITVLQLAPFLGTRAIPGRARIATAVAFSVFLYPLLVPPLLPTFPDDNGLIMLLFLKEVLFGFAIGFVTVMVFYAIEAAGRIADLQGGGGNAQLFVPQLGQVSLFGLYNFWLAISFFLAVGGHRLFIKALFLSFDTVPLLTLPHIQPGFSEFLAFLVRLSGNVLVIATQLAAPVLIASLLVDTVLGIANKMAPQINVFELGFSIRGIARPLILYVSLLTVVGQMDLVMKEMNQSVIRLSNIFAK